MTNRNEKDSKKKQHSSMNTSWKKKVSMMLAGVVATSSAVSPVTSIVAEASSLSTTVSFNESQSQSQSKTITLPNLVSVDSVSVNTGNVTYSRSGDNVTINVSGGSPSRTVWDSTQFSKTATKSLTNSTNLFPSTTSYSDSSGYSGTLSKSGTATVISGTYTPSDTKTVSQTRYQSTTSFPSTISYSSGGYTGTLTGASSYSSRVVSGSASVSKTATDYRTSSKNSFPSTVSYNSGGYSGTLSKSGSAYVQSGSYTASSTTSRSGYVSSNYCPSLSGYSTTSCTRYGVHTVVSGDSYSAIASYYYGTWVYIWGTLEDINNQDSRRLQIGSKLLLPLSIKGSNGVTSNLITSKVKSGYYYKATYTKPASDTRVWRQNYSGTVKTADTRVYEYYKTYTGSVTKPASDTRTWKQNYSGTAYKGGNDYYYSYNVAVKYTTDTTPPALPTFTPSTTSPTNSNVSVTVNFPSDSVTKQYSINGGSWTTYSTPITMTANGYIDARSADKAGNWSSSKRYTVSNIDKTAPSNATFSPSTTSPTNSNVTVGISYPSDAVAKEYRINGGTWTSYSSAISMSANGKIEARSKDNAGNYSAITTYNVTNIDKTAPGMASLTPSTTAPTNGNVSVTIGYPSDASVKQYKIGSTGTWTSYSTPVTVTSNNTVYARSFDAVGNVSAESNVVISNIDKTAPANATFSPSTTSPTNQNVTVGVNYPSDAVVKEVSINDGTWTSYSLAIVMSANGKIEARSKDNAGNYSAITTYNVTNIDKTAPANATFSPSTTSPTNQNVSVAIGYPSDAVAKEYRINGGTWTSYSSAISMSANGKIEARSKDNAGNYSSIKAYSVSNIDKTAPASATFSPSTTLQTNQNVTVGISYPTDAVVKQYNINGGTWTSYTSAISMSANGVINARSQDNAGNWSSTKSYTVSNIDKIAPQNATITPSNTNPTNQNVTISVDYPTDATITQYRINGGTWTSYELPFAVSQNGLIEARSFDGVGNVSGIVSYKVTNIDKTAPTVPTFAPSETAKTNDPVSVSISYPSDTVVKQYRKDGGTWTSYTSPISFSYNGKVEARGQDSAGNWSSIGVYNVTNIDKTPPATATITPSTTEPTNQPVTVTISYPGDAVIKQVKVGETGVWTSYTSPIVVNDNTVIYTRAYDVAGNESAGNSYEVTNIDKVAPTTPTFAPSTKNPTNQNVSVGINFPSDAHVKEFRKDGGTWTVYSSAIVFSANGSVEARAIDEAGNVSNVSKYTVTNIDKTAPTVPTLSANVTSPTNTDVVVTATFPSDVVKKEVRINNGSWMVYSTPITMSENGKVEVRGTDNANNVSAIATYNVTNIDKDAPDMPSLTPSTTEPTNKDVQVSAIYATDVVRKEYRKDNGTWTGYTAPITFSQNGTLEVRGWDNAGNVSEVEKYDVTNIDKVKPNIATLTPSTTAPTNTSVTVSASYPSDVVLKEVKINSGDWVEYTTPVVLSDNGTVEVRGWDNAGNVSEVTKYEVTNIDKVAPVTPSIVADNTKPTNDKVLLSATFSSDSVVKQYRINNGAWNSYTAPITFNENGTFDVRSIDNAGNISTISRYSVTNIDKIAPVKATLVADKTEPTNQKVYVSATFANDVVTKEVRVNGGEWVAYESAVEFSSNGKIEVRGWDNAGNVSEISSYEVTNIDTVKPETATLSADVTAPTNQTVTLTATFPTDVVKKEMRINNGEWVNYEKTTFSNNGTIDVRGWDNAGNVSDVAQYDVTNIDKVAPTKPEFSANPTAPTNQQVDVSVAFSSDSVVKQVRKDGGTWVSYEGKIIFLENGTLEARSYDNAGNVSVVSSYDVKNIDKTSPEVATFEANTAKPTNQNVSVAVTFPNDAVKKEVRVNDGEWNSYESPIVFEQNGKVEARSYDNANNLSDVSSYSVTNIDKVVPVSPTETVTLNSNKVTVTGEEGSTHFYRINEGTWNTYTKPVVTEDGSYKFEFKTVDDAGNESSISSKEVVMYRDALADANNSVETAENEPTQGNVDVAKEKVSAIPQDAPEYEPLMVRVNEIQKLIDAQNAIIKAQQTNSLEDVAIAQEKISLLDSSSPIIIELMDDIEEGFEEAEIMALVEKERYDILSTKYKMSKVSYTALVNTHYANKYTGDYMYQFATEKVALVPATDKHYEFVQTQFERLTTHYKEWVEKTDEQRRINQAESSLSVTEGTYDPDFAEGTQEKIDAVQTEEVKEEMQERLDTTKEQYEAEQAEKVAQLEKEALEAVVKAEEYKTQYLVDHAYIKVNALANETLKVEYQNRLAQLKVYLQNKAKFDYADKVVTMAEQYKRDYYFNLAQIKIDELPESPEKDSLQERLDAVKPPVQEVDQTKAVKDAQTWVGMAQTMKTQYYVDKAQTFVDLVEDPTSKAELQAKLDAVVVK